MDESLSRKCYGSWLDGYNWNSFGTYTFKHLVSPQAALRAWGRFISDGFQEWAKRGAWNVPESDGWFWFAGVEEGRLYGRVHLHALMGHPDDQGLDLLRCAQTAAAWRQRNGIARVEPVEPGRGATYYVSKYVTKDLSEWQIGGAFPVLGPLQTTPDGDERPSWCLLRGPQRPGSGSFTGRSPSKQPDVASLPLTSYPPAGPESTSRSSWTDGSLEIEQASTLGLRIRILRDTCQISLDSITRSISAIRSSGLT